jgi:ATP-dependent protease ClpP protease subunit
MEAPAASDPSVLDIHIIDFIGDWMDQAMNEAWGEQISITAKAFVDALSAIPASVKTLRVHVNSPGGDVFAAINIANALRDQRATKGRAVETIVDGLAASAASLIVMAGSPARMSDNGLLMVHNAWTIAIGNAAEMRKAADTLDQLRNAQIVPTYQWHSPMTAEAIQALMDAETWMDADQAIANGFVDEKVAGLKAAASIDPRTVGKLKVPEQFRARIEALVAKPEPTPPAPMAAAATDVLRLCRKGECLDLAESLVASGATLETVQASVTTERQTRTAAAARATEIRALCAKAKLPDLADGYVAGGMTPDAVRMQLTIVTAKLDRIEIDGSLKPDQGTQPKARIDTAKIYADRNQVRAQ